MAISLDTFITSDTHFGHEAVLRRERGRVALAKHYDYKDSFKLIVDNWNSVVSENDSVLHLGDVYFGDGLKYIKQLNGSKRLIIGNNDVRKFENLIKLGWKMKNKVILKIPQKDRVKRAIKEKYGEIDEKIFLNGLIMDIGTHRILFSHFPVFDRKKNDRFSKIRDVLDDYYRLSDCSLNIHGHTHSKDTKHSFCINLSCEKTMLKPVRLGEILRKV